MVCSYKNCKPHEKTWLPVDTNKASEVALHPWCVHCGLVKNIPQMINQRRWDTG